MNKPMKTIKARPEHEVLCQEINALIGKHAHVLAAIELLAVAANMLGKLVALQDQRIYTPDQVMEVVAKNIEVGNKQMIEELTSKTQGTA